MNDKYDDLLKTYSAMISQNDQDPINMFGIEVPMNFYNILERMFVQIDALKLEPGILKISQIKLKFNDLIVFMDGFNDLSDKNTKVAISDIITRSAWDITRIIEGED